MAGTFRKQQNKLIMKNKRSSRVLKAERAGGKSMSQTQTVKELLQGFKAIEAHCEEMRQHMIARAKVKGNDVVMAEMVRLGVPPELVRAGLERPWTMQELFAVSGLMGENN